MNIYTLIGIHVIKIFLYV